MAFLISIFSRLRREFKNKVSHMEVFERNFAVSSTSEGFVKHTLSEKKKKRSFCPSLHGDETLG